MMRGVAGVRKSIHQSWLERLTARVWREFRKRFHPKRPALFKSGQWHFHQDNALVHNTIMVTDDFTRKASRQFLTFPIIQTMHTVTFGYSLSSEAVVMIQLRRWKRLWRRSLTCYERELQGRFLQVVGMVQKAHYSWRRLGWRGLEFHMSTINENTLTKKSHTHTHIYMSAAASVMHC